MLVGWVKLHRETLTKAIWKCSTPEQKVIFITILMLANHKHNQWIWKGQKFECCPGQFITSIKSLADYAEVSIKNVRTALLKFEKLEFLANESASDGRRITVLNWDRYQNNIDEGGKPSGKGAAKDGQRGGKGVATIEEGKTLKKDNKDKIKYAEFVFLTEVEYKKIEEIHGKFWTKKIIEKLDNHKGASGQTYKSDYRAILSWAVEAIKSSPKYIDWKAKERRKEALGRSRGEKQPLPGAEQIGTKIDEATVTNETPPEIN